MLYTIAQMIFEEEGFYISPYYDDKGVRTIGYGFTNEIKLTKSEKELLGIEKIDDLQSISQKNAKSLVNRLIIDTISELRDFDWYKNAPTYIKIALVDLTYNIGLTKLLKFKKMINFLEVGDYESASIELLDSNYVTDVKGRALRLSILMSTSKLLQIEHCRWMWNVLKNRM